MKMENSYYVLPGLMPVTLDDQRIENLNINLLPSPIPPDKDSTNPGHTTPVLEQIKIARRAEVNFHESSQIGK